MQLGLKSNNIDLPLTAIDFIKFGNNYSSAITVYFSGQTFGFYPF